MTVHKKWLIRQTVSPWFAVVMITNYCHQPPRSTLLTGLAVKLNRYENEF